MTNEFRELTNRLAKGMNRDDCFAILISGQGEGDINISINGKLIDAVLGLIAGCRAVLNDLGDETGEAMHKALKRVIIAYEEQKFQKGETE